MTDQQLKDASKKVIDMLEEALQEMKDNNDLPGGWVQQKLMVSLLASPEVTKLRQVLTLKETAINQKLLAACKQALAAMEAALEAEDPQAPTQMEWEAEPLATLRQTIAEAEQVARPTQETNVKV